MNNLPHYVKTEKTGFVTYSKLLHNDPAPTSYPNCISVVISSEEINFLPATSVDLCECIEISKEEFERAFQKIAQLATA